MLPIDNIPTNQTKRNLGDRVHFDPPIPLKMHQVSRTSLDTLQESEEPFLKDPEASRQYSDRLEKSTYFSWTVTVPWVFCLVLLIGNAFQARQSGLFSGPPPKYYWSERELGKLTNNITIRCLTDESIDIAKKEIPATLKHVRFTGGLRYNETKHLYREIEPNQVDYVGHPTPEIESAWEELISSMCEHF